jgi:hypothetical protein
VHILGDSEMSEALAILGFIVEALPTIEKLIVGVEGLFPQGGQGAAKLAAVAGAVQEAAVVAGNVNTTAQQIVPMVTPIINSIVAIKNSTGAFATTA